MFQSLLPTIRRAGRAEDPVALLQREMNRLFEDTFRGVLPATNGGMLTPSVDLQETDTGLKVSVELPGVDEKDVHVTYEDGLLVVKGEKKSEKEEKKEGYVYSERSFGSFYRAIELPAAVDPERIEAHCEKGVLTVTLPKLPAEKSKARRIEVKSGK